MQFDLESNYLEFRSISGLLHLQTLSNPEVTEQIISAGITVQNLCHLTLPRVFYSFERLQSYLNLSGSVEVFFECV